MRPASDNSIDVIVRVDPVCFGLSATEVLSIEVCRQGVQGIGSQTVARKRLEMVVAAMSGRLKPYLYFELWCDPIANPL